MFDLLIQAIDSVFTWQIFAMMIFGLAVGVFAGAVPGVNGGIAMALTIPLTYKLGFLPAIVFLSSIYTGDVFGGAITAILINTPGTSAAIATCLDGYPMSQRGESNEALGLSLGASVLGGFIGIIFLILVVTPLAEFALKFGPPELFLLVLLALTCIASISRTDLIKGLLAGLLGILIGSIGMTATGAVRFTFGSTFLLDGIPVIPALIGFISFPELFELMGKEYIAVKKAQSSIDVVKICKGMAMVPKKFFILLRSSIIGIAIGAVPGVGATVASLVSYDVAKRSSKRSEEFGTGIPDGIIAAESANNASEGGALATMLALGIPGGAATAILIGAFLLQGLVPGPRLLIENQSLVYSLLVAELIEEILLLPIGFLAAVFFVRILDIPTKIIIPVVTVICVIGVFSFRMTLFDSYLLLSFGLLGWIMKINGYPVIAVVIGIILGPIADSEFLRTYEMYSADFTVFFTRPICLVLVILILSSLFLPSLISFFLKKNKLGKT